MCVITFGKFSAIINSNVPYILFSPSPASILVIFVMSSYVTRHSSGMFFSVFCLLFSSLSLCISEREVSADLQVS